MSIKSLSISQINLFQKSPRRWVLEYLEKVRMPATEHLSFGTDLHEYIESCILKTPYAGGLSAKNIEYLDRWMLENDWVFSKYRIEDDFKIWLRADLPPFRGRIDMHCVYPDGKVCVVDHKTANPRYTKTIQELKQDPQLCLYLYVLMQSSFLTKSREENDIVGVVTHNYFFKGRNDNGGFYISGAEKRTAEVTYGTLMTVINDLVATAEAMRRTYRQYEFGGLLSVPIGECKGFWYGQRDKLYPCLNGEESVEECKKRLGID